MEDFLLVSTSLLNNGQTHLFQKSLAASGRSEGAKRSLSREGELGRSMKVGDLAKAGLGGALPMRVLLEDMAGEGGAPKAALGGCCRPWLLWLRAY